jgi:excisionase family DNA binding protein
MNETDILTIREVAKLLRISWRTVYRMARAGELPGWQMPGGGWRFTSADIAAFIAGRAKAGRRRQPNKNEHVDQKPATITAI